MTFKYFRNGEANYEDSRTGFLGRNIAGEFTGKSVIASIKTGVTAETVGQRIDSRGLVGSGSSSTNFTGKYFAVWEEKEVFEVKTKEGCFWVDKNGSAVTFEDNKMPAIEEEKEPVFDVIDYWGDGSRWHVLKDGKKAYEYDGKGMTKNGLNWEQLNAQPFIPDWIKKYLKPE